MKTAYVLLPYIVNIGASLFLIYLGAIALFFPKKMAKIYKDKPPINKFLLRLYKFREKKRKTTSYNFNQIIAGIVIISTGVFLLYHMILRIIG